MAHNRHLMQAGLPVDHDVVAILQVPFDFVAVLEVYVGAVGHHREVDLAAVVADNIFGSGPGVWTSGD